MKEMRLELICCEYPGARIGIYKVWTEPSTEDAVPTLHAHETYEIHLATEGAYTFTVSGRAVPLQRGQFLILPPGVEHYSCDHTGDCTLVSLNFSLEKTDEPDGFYPYFRCALDGCAENPCAASRALIQCISDFANESFDLRANVYCRLKVLASQIVYHLFSDIDGFGVEKAATKSTHRIHSTAYLVECLVNEPSYTLSDISVRTGYSPRHVTRIIQSMYGKSLREIRVERSVEHAKTLLRTTDKTVEEIATQTGFGTALAMRRAFLKREGVSPGTYRKTNKKGE